MYCLLGEHWGGKVGNPKIMGMGEIAILKRDMMNLAHTTLGRRGSTLPKNQESNTPKSSIDPAKTRRQPQDLKSSPP